MRNPLRGAALQAFASVTGERYLVEILGYSVTVEQRAGDDYHRVVFRGSPTGEHALNVDVSDQARVLAHWEGYRPAPQESQVTRTYTVKRTYPRERDGETIVEHVSLVPSARSSATFRCPGIEPWRD